MLRYQLNHPTVISKVEIKCSSTTAVWPMPGCVELSLLENSKQVVILASAVIHMVALMVMEKGVLLTLLQVLNCLLFGHSVWLCMQAANKQGETPLAIAGDLAQSMLAAHARMEEDDE
jgi:hypothetical protein